MTLPQITVLGVLALNWSVVAHMHGKPRTGVHDIREVTIGVLLWLYLLTWGHFF